MRTGKSGLDDSDLGNTGLGLEKHFEKQFILNIRPGHLRGIFRAVYISDIRCGCLRGRYRNMIFFWHPPRILPQSYLDIDIFWKSVTDDSAEASGKWYIFHVQSGKFDQPERMPLRIDTNRVYFKHPAWGPPWIIPSSVYFGHTMRMPPRKVLQQDIFLTPAADTSAELSEYRYNLEVRYGCFRGSFREVTYFQYPRWKFWPTRTDASADWSE